MNLQTLCDRAVVFHQRGQFPEAEKLYLEILAIDPGHFTARHYLGLIRHEQGRNAEARTLIGTALKTNPDVAEAFSDYALVLGALGQIREALASCDKALEIRPNFAEALYNRATILEAQKRNEEALSSYDKAILIRPHFAEAFNNRGNVLLNLSRVEEALASFDRALIFKPDYVSALNNRGNALIKVKRFNEALASFDKALAIMPGIPEVLSNRGNALRNLYRFDAAIASFDKALAIKPDYVEALINLGITWHELGRYEKALASYDRALATQPDNAEAIYNRGNALLAMSRLEEALWCYERSVAIKPGDPHGLSNVANAALQLCDWRRTDRISRALRSHIVEGKAGIQPFILLGYSDDPVLQLQCAKNNVREIVPVQPRSLWEGKPYHHKKIRIAYLSADFRKHATAYLIAGLFECHNKQDFEVFGISYNSDDGSAMHARLVKSFDQFHDVRSKSDIEVASTLRRLEVDIAVDLKGYTTDSRPGILSHRPCPVQVNYLGYPGTLGADFIDYVIADKVVVPFEQQTNFTERIVHLPGCYQVNDSKRKISELTPTRAEAGLPERGFVFCCFNVSWKITPPVFDIWMRLLSAVPGSVLWLIEHNSNASVNLQLEAKARGIDPSRLVFAERTELAEHLARHRLADLFLDTIPCNAHTTASDALWAGLPLLTCAGNSFAARAAASLLRAIDLPELITNNLDDYEALALKLARDPALLRSLRVRLDQNRLTHSLFNTDLFRRNVEIAYKQMREIAERGDVPKSFSVEPPFFELPFKQQ
jgi:protein O-GlcNAc transferase